MESPGRLLPLGLILAALPGLALVVWCMSLLLGSVAGGPAPEGTAPAGPAAVAVAAIERPPLDSAEPPLLVPLVEENVLPPLAERLPAEPKVIDGPDTPNDPAENPYGGTWLRLATADADVGIIAHRLSMSTPLRWTPDGEGVVPHVAESLTANDDDTEFTLRLREGHRWSDGAPFTTADVMFWWEHEVLDPTLGDGRVPDWLTQAGEAATIEATSPTELVIRFARPNGLFPRQLASIGTWQMLASPRHYLKKVHPTLGDPGEIARRARALSQPSPVALYRDLKLWNNPEIPRLWPWICRDRRDSAPFVFVRNPYYFCVDAQGRQLPYIDRVQFDVQGQALLALAASNGQASMQARGLGFDKYTDLMSRRDAGGYDVLRWEASGPAWVLHPNQNRTVEPDDPATVHKAELLADPRFREALSLAIDRERIVRAEYLGQVEPAAQVDVPGSAWFPPREAEPLHDPQRAKALLDELGLERPRPGAMRRHADELLHRLLALHRAGPGGLRRRRLGEGRCAGDPASPGPGTVHAQPRGGHLGLHGVDGRERPPAAALCPALGADGGFLGGRLGAVVPGRRALR